MKPLLSMYIHTISVALRMALGTLPQRIHSIELDPAFTT